MKKERKLAGMTVKLAGLVHFLSSEGLGSAVVMQRLKIYDVALNVLIIYIKMWLSMGVLILKNYIRSCKSFGGPVKLGFSMWWPVLRSSKGPKVFSMSAIWTSVSAKFACPRPKAGNRGGGLTNEAFTGPAGLAIICENYIGCYYLDMQDLQFKYFCGSSSLHGLQRFCGHWNILQTKMIRTKMEMHRSHINGLMQGRRNSIALAMELRLSCITPSIWTRNWFGKSISA